MSCTGCRLVVIAAMLGLILMIVQVGMLGSLLYMCVLFAVYVGLILLIVQIVQILMISNGMILLIVQIQHLVHVAHRHVQGPSYVV
jgi:hypothetical protein